MELSNEDYINGLVGIRFILKEAEGEVSPQQFEMHKMVIDHLIEKLKKEKE